MEGTRFGRYQLEEVIGEGGMGQVYRARDTQIDRVVAVKVLPVQTAADKVFRERFRREARAAAGLGNPHIVPIHDFGEIDGHLFICMQLIEGQGIDEILAASGPLSAIRAVSMIEQVASALDAAHAAGLVHRDVKPSNLLVTASDFVYLIDFGIARAAGETALTTTGATIGTFAYISPERFTTGIADARSDIYALACILYQLLTDQTPFPVVSLEQQIAAHLTLPPPKPSTVRPELSTILDPVVVRGMAKDPDDRYQTASELAYAATMALTPPVEATAPPLSVPSGPPFTPSVSSSSPPAAPSPAIEHDDEAASVRAHLASVVRAQLAAATGLPAEPPPVPVGTPPAAPQPGPRAKFSRTAKTQIANAATAALAQPPVVVDPHAAATAVSVKAPVAPPAAEADPDTAEESAPSTSEEQPRMAAATGLASRPAPVMTRPSPDVPKPPATRDANAPADEQVSPSDDAHRNRIALSLVAAGLTLLVVVVLVLVVGHPAGTASRSHSTEISRAAATPTFASAQTSPAHPLQPTGQSTATVPVTSTTTPSPPIFKIDNKPYFRGSCDASGCDVYAIVNDHRGYGRASVTFTISTDIDGKNVVGGCTAETPSIAAGQSGTAECKAPWKDGWPSGTIWLDATLNDQ